jgi:hypothetical protein
MPAECAKVTSNRGATNALSHFNGNSRTDKDLAHDPAIQVTHRNLRAAK